MKDIYWKKRTPQSSVADSKYEDKWGYRHYVVALKRMYTPLIVLHFREDAYDNMMLIININKNATNDPVSMHFISEFLLEQHLFNEYGYLVPFYKDIRNRIKRQLKHIDLKACYVEKNVVLNVEYPHLMWDVTQKLLSGEYK